MDNAMNTDITQMPEAPSKVDTASRARSLRTLANSTEPIVATAFRRRAAELEFQAWLEEVHTGSTVTVEAALGEAA